jgi:hypothetical protein
MISGTGPGGTAQAPSARQDEGRPTGPRGAAAAPPRALGNGGMAEFRLDGLTEYSEAEILSELARVAALVPGRALTIAQFKRHSMVSYPTLRRRFRGWKEALEAAGLGRRYGGQSLGGRMRGPRPARGMSDAAILAAVREHARALGRDRLKTEDFKHHPFLSAATLWRRFGRWRHAMDRAGLKTGRYAGPWSDQECFENLRAVWVHLGRAPTAHEMARPPSRIGATAYLRRWGKWRLTLRAFVERANREPARGAGEPAAGSEGIAANGPGTEANGAPGVAPRPAPAGVEPAETVPAGMEPERPDPAAMESAGAEAAGAEPAPPLSAQGRRHVPVSLRFRIMQRDGFRCTACGNSPAIDRGCRLEIDHVLPYSKGGPTEPANLRTLCSACNLGKSDSIETNPLRPGECGARPSPPSTSSG